jgi:septal ring factor EnvC (AmiA/AmiB activator)
LNEAGRAGNTRVMKSRRWLLGAAIVFASSTAFAADDLDATLGQMTKTSRSVRELLRTTRKRGTEQQIKCVDESLSRVDVAAREARAKAADARAADARGDSAAARAAKQRIGELAAAVRLASRDANRCVPPPPPPPKVLLGTVVKVTVDPTLPPDTSQ